MGKRIMTVDDSNTFRMILALSLSQAGHSVVEVDSAECALEKLETTKVDMVITDLMMPGMDGVELTSRIRQSARHRQVPILLLTTEDQEEKKDLGRRAGADGWIVKPFNHDEFIAAVEDLLQ